MKTIWKFHLPITDVVEIPMPIGAQILMIEDQNSQPSIWALVDPYAGLERRKFLIFGTGAPSIPEGLTHLGSFQDRQFVWHVFEEAPHQDLKLDEMVEEVAEITQQKYTPEEIEKMMKGTV